MSISEIVRRTGPPIAGCGAARTIIASAAGISLIYRRIRRIRRQRRVTPPDALSKIPFLSIENRVNELFCGCRRNSSITFLLPFYPFMKYVQIIYKCCELQYLMFKTV